MFGKLKNLTIAAKLVISFSLIIAMFTGSHIYSAFSYWQANRLHLYRINFVNARGEYLLEFRHNLTELRRLQEISILSPGWLQETDVPTRLEYENSITTAYMELHRLANLYVYSVANDPLFGASAASVRITTMEEILTYLDQIYYLFSDNFFLGGTGDHQIGNVPDYTAIVDNSLQMLMRFAEQANEEVLRHIQSSLRGIVLLTVAIILLVIVVAVLLAYLMIKAVSKMSIEKELSLLKAMPFAVGLWDDKYTPLDCNQKTLEMFGFSNKEDSVKLFRALSPEIQPCGTPSKDKSLFYMKQAMREGQARFEFMHLTATGEPLPTEIVFVRIKSGNRFMLASYTNDLRDIKNAMAKIREADERAMLMLDATPLSCFLVKRTIGEDGTADVEVMDCNHAALDLFGFSSKEEAIARFKDLHPEFQGDDPMVARLFEHTTTALDKGYHCFEFTHRHMNGEPIPCRITLVRVDYKGEPVLACYQDDLREEKRRELAEEESRAKSRFLARMSHEIRTPMNAVLGITEIQLQKEGHPPDTEEAFLRIQSSSNLLLTIINDILDLSKVEAGKMEIIPETYDLASMIVDTVQLNIMRLGSKSIEFKLNVNERLPTSLIGDELRIKQILNNILSNAFKYTNEGQVVLSVDLGDSPTPNSVMLVFRVQDTGQGMTQDQIESLFDFEFTRFNLRSNRVIEGAGLGMTIAYQLANMMEGDIKAESESGKGSVFTVNIPQMLNGSDMLGRETVENLQNLEISQKSLKKMSRLPRIPMPYGRVLVVDDVESNLHVVKGILMPYKIAVETVSGGHDAVEKVRAGGVYDIIFMDHMMPGMDGIEATKAIRKLGYGHPIVALTANTLKGVAEMFLNNGFSGFVPKPIDMNQFHSYLVRYIRDKQPPEVIEAAEKQYADAEITEELLDNLRESFLLDAHRAVGILEPLLQKQELDKDDLARFVIQTHAMKSAFFNIERAELSKAAFALEMAGRESDVEAIRASAPQFMDNLRKVITELSPTNTGRDATDEDLDFLRDQFDTIAQSCERFDINAANKAIDRLNQRQHSKKTKELIKNIAANLLYGDFDEAAALASRAASAMQFISDIKGA